MSGGRRGANTLAGKPSPAKVERSFKPGGRLRAATAGGGGYG